MSDLLDVQEAAAYLTVSRSTLYQLVADRKLTKLKVRGSTRFRRSDLDRFLRDAERVA